MQSPFICTHPVNLGFLTPLPQPCDYVRQKMMFLKKKKKNIHFTPTYFLFTFLGSLLRKQDVSKFKAALRKSFTGGEAAESRSDSSYRKELWLLTLSCSVTYHQLGHYVAHESCNKLSDLLLSRNDGMEICSAFEDIGKGWRNAPSS